MSTIGIVLQEDAWSDVEAGTEALVEDWLVKEGDTVATGQPVATVVLVKSNFEVTAPAAGVIEKILVQREETFAQGKAIGLLKEVA